MISFLAILLIILILILTLMQTLLVLNYNWLHRESKANISVETEDIYGRQDVPKLPRAAIILCLRGDDESTEECIAELVGQDYSDYELHIAFDSKTDPAAQQIEELFKDHGAKAQLHFFEPKEQCSYKCSGIVHVIEQLGDDIEFVAFCDGDAIVDADWLSDLIEPMMHDRKIGATTGNRWFAPFNDAIAAQVRKLWNSAAVVQMQAYDIAWGGSLAVRRSTIEKCNLSECWSKAFCEDTLLTQAMKKEGLVLHRVPGLVIENKETTTFMDCFEWIARQLLTVRLHHRGWPLVLAHGIVTGLATIVAPIAIILLLVFGYLNEGRSLLIIWTIYQIANFFLLKVVSYCNETAIVRRRGTESSNPPPRAPKWEILALIAVQFLHPLAAIKTMLMKDVSWRGVRYAIDDKQIRVIEK